jgi:hypothetical protein
MRVMSAKKGGCLLRLLPGRRFTAAEREWGGSCAEGGASARLRGGGEWSCKGSARDVDRGDARLCV